MQPRANLSATSPRPLPQGAGLGGAAPWRRAFSLVELLVVVSIILVLMALTGAAVSGARSSQKKQATQALIAKLDAVIQQQYESYAARYVEPGRLQRFTRFIPDPAAAAAWYVRRHVITADLPDRWADVQYLAEHTDYLNPQAEAPIVFPSNELTAAQKAYVGIWRSRPTPPTDQFAGAECLFMLIMQGGIANCLTCDGLDASDIGDTDGDGAPEFLDAWGSPIGFILWPAAVELPSGSGDRFFSGPRGFFRPVSGDQLVSSEDRNGDGVLSSGEDVNGNGTLDVVTPTLGMKPLIYSPGMDREYAFETRIERSNLAAGVLSPDPEVLGRDCGNPDAQPANELGRPIDGRAADNITNLDAEAKQ